MDWNIERKKEREREREKKRCAHTLTYTNAQ